jgi:hypothetical protein
MVDLHLCLGNRLRRMVPTAAILILQRAPLRLLRWNEILISAPAATEIEFSGSGPKVKVPLKSLLQNIFLISRYGYHKRVLEAWVNSHMRVAG